MTGPGASMIASWIDRQLENYATLLDLGRVQASREASDWDGDSLLRLARSKSSVMGRVEEVDRELARIRERWDELVGAFTESERRDIVGRMDRLRSSLAELLRLEEANQQALAKRMASVREELDRTNRGRLIQKAYGRPDTPPGERFVDQKR